MRKIFFLLMTILLQSSMFAFTPHINRGKNEEISIEKAYSELRITEAELKEFNKEFFGHIETSTDFPSSEKLSQNTEYRVFKQTFTETKEKLYRVFFIVCDDYDEEKQNLFQKIYYTDGTSKGNLIYADYYDGLVSYNYDSFSMVQLNINLMPIIKEQKIAGIMIYGIESDIKKHITTHKAVIYWRKDFSTADLKKGTSPDIDIECSTPQIDEYDVFKYTIQNAFDKNPSTSYVEDTEDDLMYVAVINPKITKFAIINGYAANENLYFNNNIITEVADEWSKDSKNPKEKLTATNNRYKLRNDCLTYQVVNYKNFSNGYIICSKIQAGKKYSDTCIAELDFYNEKTGWILGGVK